MLTGAASREFGRKLRFLRHTRNTTLRDIAKRAQMSAQYVQNLEKGERLNPSDELLDRLPAAYEVRPEVIADLILRARIESALEKRGLDADQVEFVWRGIAPRLAEVGLEQTDVARVAAEMLR